MIVVIVLLLAAAGYFLFGKSKAGEQATGLSSGAKSLKELIAANTPQKCTFSYSDENGKTEGTTYVSGGKVRSDATNTIEGKTTVSHIISDNLTSYIWTEGEKTGIKMTVEAQEEMEADTTESTDTDAQADLDQKTDYSCTTWIPDNSLFTPPTNVTFTDLSQTANPPAAGETGDSQCSYCATLTGEDKDACLSAFSCN